MALLLAAYSFALLWEGFIADHYVGIFTYPFVDKVSAQRAYARLPTTASIPARVTASQRLIHADPTNPQSWLAVSYTDWLAHGHLTADGVKALDNSYTFSFFDRGDAVWRVGFALDNWAALPPALRDDVSKEAAVALKDPDLGPAMTQRLKTVKSPEGRIAAAMMGPDA